MKQNSVVSVVRDFILMVVKIKHGIERSQIFHFSSSEVKQRSDRSQRFHFDSSEVKQRSQRSQRFHFSVTYVKEIIFQWLVLQQQS